MDHEARWASKMICGFCSTEQRCADMCAGCKKKVAASASVNGNKKKKKKKDDPSKKYAGMFKTKCRKSERVGPKKDK